MSGGPISFHNGRVVLHGGDCLDILDGLAEASVDAIVTDPPYHLTSIVKRFGKEGSAPAQFGKDGAFARGSRGFMGKTWDGGDIAFRAETWAKVLRVLKPGGHLVAFSAPKCAHRMVCAIEDAGFEIRDGLMWVFGSGFPKSLDVSKAIQKSRRTEDEPRLREICRFIRSAMDAAGLSSKDMTIDFGNCNARLIDHWAARDTDSQPSLPTRDQWRVLKERLALGGEMDGLFDYLDARRGEYADAWNDAPIIGEYDGEPGGFGDHRFQTRDKSIRATTDSAQQWQGWGTALKPAYEPICLARKPLVGTVAENVLRHGVGALNIDATRVAVNDDQYAKNCSGDRGHADNRSRDMDFSMGCGTANKVGRWPANLVHDGSEEVLAGFPSEAGAAAPVFKRNSDKFRNAYGAFKGDIDEQGSTFHADSGSAARFFYCAKADANDRAFSKHPTVKPIALMRWLVRMVTPPGGTILDPFAGTGTSAHAALLEGFNAVLIEREEEYRADIARRMKLVFAGSVEKASMEATKPASDLPMFAGLE